MTETVTQYEWRHDEASGGLYVLYADGVRTPRTALVDRNAPRAEQLDQVNSLDWLPDYNLSRYFERIVTGSRPVLDFHPLPPDRLYDPFDDFPNLSTVVDIEENPSAHSLRSYLWPVLDPSGQLVLEPGEAHVASIPIRPPRMGAVKTIAENKALKYGLVQYTKRAVLLLTTKRLVVTARIIPPAKVQQDYAGGSSVSGKSLGLALISPTGGFFTPDLADMLAYRRGRQRKRQLAGLSPVMHVRFEWLAAVGFRVDIVQRSRALLRKRQPPRVDDAAIVVHARHAGLGDQALLRYAFPFDVHERSSAESFGTQIANSVHGAGQVSCDDAELTTVPIQAGKPGLNAIEGGERRIQTWAVRGGIPLSVPARLG